MSKKNEFQTKALAAVMTASMVTGMAPASIYAASGEQVAKDGTYTQTTHVKDGDEDGWSEYDVKVSLTVENGKFKDITVTPSESYNDESKTYLNWAVDANTPKRVGIRTKLLNQNATESTINSWDTVSGATYTSKAIKEAALAAIKSAPVADAEVKIDTAALEAAIAKADALTKDSYTEASWNAMQQKLTAAKEALSKKESQDAVTKAASELETAISGLEAAPVTPTEKVEYVLMNIPYADFYASELNNSVAVDSVSSATLNKTRTSSLVGGSYHVSQGGEDITGIVFPVKVPEGMDLSKFKQVTDSDSVTISVTSRGQTKETTYTGKDALFENASYSYYVLSEAPAYYKEATVDASGNVSFGKVQGTVNKVSGVTGEFKTTSKYGDYQLNLDGITFDTDEISAVVFSTKEGHDYGMRHLENVWKGHKIAWCTGFTTSVHGCPTSSAHYAQMMGETIDKVTYYTTKGIYEMDLDDIYVTVKTSATLSVENASVKSGETKVNFENLPSDYDAEYSVDGLDAKVENGVLKFNNATKGKYTLVVKDKKGKYADMSANFMLQTEDMPATYDAEKTALVTAEGFKAEDLQEYIKSITSVSVNGTSYVASGRGATVIVNEDGSIKTDAAPFANGAGDYQIVVSATGYKDLEFTYTVAASEEEYKYVYAGLSWAEYWASEGVYLAEGSNLTSSSDVADKKGELDKGAFDTVSRATTNHGLHRGSYQCTAVIYDTDGKEYPVSYWNSSSEAVLTDGRVITFSKGTITYTENGVEKTATMKDYEVKGIKYVPVKVKASDYAEFSKQYQVVENAGTLAGGFSEKNLQAYTEVAEVTEKTNGLKEATKNEDGSFSFGARATGSESGLKDNALKVAEGIEPEVKTANGSYGEFLRVDLNGNYGGLGAGMYATRWTYYGNDSTYTTALASYGTKFAADNWMHKSMGIQLGLTDSLRCQLPAGTDGTGYWELTVYAMGYEDYTYKFQATEENIVKPEAGEISTTELEAAIAKAEALKESDYTSDSWAAMQTELQEAKDELAAKHSQATVDEATSHLNAAIKALVKAEAAEYKYVYAGLSWAEYWASEGVYLAAGNSLTSSSDVADKKGELDKGAFDTVSRATTNHGLHRGSYQCTAVIYDTDGKEYPVSYWNSSSEAVLTDGRVITFSKGTITYTENGVEKTATMKDYEVKGIKYVPVKVKASDYAEFSKQYQVVENAGTLAGGFSEKNLQAYTEVAEVTEKTNGLKEATKNEDGSFSFGARATGSESGLKDNALKVAEGIEPEVKTANGSYGEFLRVDLNGNYGGLGAGMYATRWTYYGNDSTYTTALASYGTKFAADNWMHKSMGIQLGLTDSLRCQLPAGTDGTGYWELTVYAMGYEDYTYKFQATEENIVKPEAGEISTTELEAAIAKAEALKESDYTSDSWASMQTELQEAKEELAAKHSQATVDEATSHLNAAIEALVKAEAPVEVNTTELEKVIATAKDLKEADYTSETWNVFKGALELAESALENKESQEAVDSAAKELQSAIDGLKKADSETPAEINTTELEKVIKSAKALKEADYTSETWSALKTALETAESAFEKKESQEAVDNAAKELQSAIDGLKKKNAATDDSNKDNNTTNKGNSTTTNGTTTNKGTTTATTNKGTTGTTATTNKGTTSTSTGTTGNKSTGTTSTSSNAKTGDPTSIWGWISLAVTSMGVGGFSWKARKKSRKDEEEK